MAECSVGMELHYSAIQKPAGVDECLRQRTIPDATYRNWNTYSSKVGFDKRVNVMEAFNLLPDPADKWRSFGSCGIGWSGSYKKNFFLIMVWRIIVILLEYVLH